MDQQSSPQPDFTPQLAAALDTVLLMFEQYAVNQSAGPDRAARQKWFQLIHPLFQPLYERIHRGDFQGIQAAVQSQLARLQPKGLP